MMHFYDGQIRRYIKQMIRLFSHFSYKDGDGELNRTPVVYGDMSRLAASMLKDGSEATVGAVPKIAVYITALEIDRNRTSDSTFVSKVHIRERAFDKDNNEYLNTEGKNYTVERLMPTPYKLTMNADILTSNTDQKLQLLEQILVLFNPSLEIQTTDNFVDWTSLTVVDLDSVNFSSRSIGSASTETEIDVATLTVSTPIYISAPVKVKRLNVIHTIITSIFNESRGDIDKGESMPELLAWASDHAYNNDTKTRPVLDEDGNVTYESDYLEGSRQEHDAVSWATTYHNYALQVLNNKAKLIDVENCGLLTWRDWIEVHGKPNCYEPGITEMKLYRNDYQTEISGTISIDPQDEYALDIAWDQDTLPSDTVITGPNGDATKLSYIINPLVTNPTDLKTPGLRLLLLNESIGAEKNVDGADGWKNLDGTDFIAEENDIVEWSGSKWYVVFDASQHTGTDPVFVTNLNTGIQYKYNGTEWLLSYEGEYINGTWRIAF